MSDPIRDLAVAVSTVDSGVSVTHLHTSERD